MAEVEIRLKTKSGTTYSINRFNGLKYVDTTTESTADPKTLSYGLLANTGSAKIIDVDGQIASMIESGELDSKNVPAEIYVNGNKIAQHITSDSDYSQIDKLLALNFTNDIEELYNIKYRYAPYLIKDSDTLLGVLRQIFVNLNWTNEIDYTLSNHITENYIVENYLNKFTINNPYLLGDNVGDIINKICQTAQLNAIKDSNNRLMFVSAVPKRIAAETFEERTNTEDSIIHIPRKMQVTRPNGSLFREGQIKNIQYSKRFIKSGIGTPIDKDFNLRDGDGNLDLSPLGTQTAVITNGANNYLCFVISFTSDENTLYYIERNRTALGEYPFSYSITYTDDSSEGGSIVGILSSNVSLEDLQFESLGAGATILQQYEKLNSGVFALALRMAYGKTINDVKSVSVRVKGREYNISSQEPTLLNNESEYSVFENNDLSSVGTVYDNDVDIYEFWGENTIPYFENGIRTLKLTVFAGDYYENIQRWDGNSQLWVDFQENGQVIDVDQNCYVDIDNAFNSAYKYSDGSNVVWRVVSRTVRYDGAVYFDLVLQECPKVVDMERLATPTVSLSGNYVTISAVPNASRYVLYIDDVEVLSSTSRRIYLPHYVTEAGTYSIYVKARAAGYKDSKRSNVLSYVKEYDNETWVFNQICDTSFPATFGNDITETRDFETQTLGYRSSMVFHVEGLPGSYRNDIYFDNDIVYNSPSINYQEFPRGWRAESYKTITFDRPVDTSTAFGIWVSSNGTKQ